MSNAIQLTLFGDNQAATPEEAKIEWSYSRRQTLDRCARRYYYDYYGSKVRVAVTDPLKEDIRFLKTLSNRYLRSGDILHIAIRLFYKRGESARDWLVNWARRTYRDDYEYSRSNSESGPSDERYPPKMLLEFYYGQPDAEELYAASERRLLDALETFLTNPVYASMRRAGQHPHASVEEWIRVKTTTFDARGKIDLATFQDGKVAIVDWKTGKAEALSTSLQLAFYGLWAVEMKGHCLEDVALYRGHLGDGSLRPVMLNEQTLLRVQARIAQDIERMRVLDEYGRNGEVEVFSPCGFPKICVLCPYQRICPGITIGS
jgi:hypothetical protein